MKAKAIRSGQLRHLVEVQSATTTKDANGGMLQTWATIGSRWASIEMAGAAETVDGAHARGEEEYSMVMRYYAGLSVEHRIVHGEDAYNIISIEDAELRRRTQHLRLRKVAS